MPNLPDNPRRLSRRDFLRMGAVAAGAAIGTGIVAALGASGTEDIQAASQKPPYSPGPRAAIKDLQVITKDISVPVIEKTPVVSNSNTVLAVKNEIEPDVKIAVPVFRVEPDVDNGFGVEGARKIEASIEDIEDYYLKTFGPPIEAPEGPILVAKAPNNSNPRAYSYGESENYPNGAIFVQSPDTEIDLAHETKHKFPLPYEGSGLLEMNGVDHLGGELFTVAAARQWGIDRRDAEPQYLDEGSLVYQSLRRDDKFFAKLNERWIRAGKPDPKSVDKETWGKWAEEVSPGFKNWLSMVKDGPIVSREGREDEEMEWDADVKGRLNGQRYVWWYDRDTPWFMPFGRAPKRLGPDRYLVTTFAEGTTYPDVGPKGSTPYADALFLPDQKPLGRWVRSKRQ